MWPFNKKEERNWFPAFAELLKTTSEAGTSVTQADATELPVVYRCWSLNADMVSTMPVDVLVKRDGRRDPYPEPLWLRRPNERQDLQQLLHEAQISYEADGNIFLLKAVDDSGRLVGLEVLDPGAVTPRLVDLGAGPRKVYEVNTIQGKEILAGTSVVHIHGTVVPGTLRGMSPITQVLFTTIGTGKAAQQFAARFFGSGAVLSGVIEYPGGPKDLNKEAAERLKADFERKHGGISKSHAIGILSGGAKFTPLSVKPVEAELIKLLQLTDVRIAHSYGIPPEYVTEAEGAKGYVSGLYMRQAMWLITGINPRLVRWENALSALLPRPAYIKFNRNAMLIMSPQERAQFYDSMQMGERISVDEIRALEDMNPLGGEYSKPLKSVQWVHEGDAPPAGEEEPRSVINVTTPPVHVDAPIRVDARTSVDRGALQVNNGGIARGAISVGDGAPALRLVREKRFIFDPDNPDRITGVREVETDQTEDAING